MTNTTKRSPFLIKGTVYQSQIFIADDVAIQSKAKKPNIFWRVMAWLLLGWRWESINDDS